MSRIQSDAVALANDGAPAASSTPPDVAVRHCQTGVGTDMIEHRVEIWDNNTGLMLASYSAVWAARWLAQRGYHYVPGTNGLWQL